MQGIIRKYVPYTMIRLQRKFLLKERSFFNNISGNLNHNFFFNLFKIKIFSNKQFFIILDSARSFVIFKYILTFHTKRKFMNLRDRSLFRITKSHVICKSFCKFCTDEAKILKVIVN